MKTTSDVPPSFKNLLRLAEGRGKPSIPNNKVSHTNIKSKPFVLSKPAECRPGGSAAQQRCEEYADGVRGRDDCAAKTRDVRECATRTRDVRDRRGGGGGVTDDGGGGQKSVVGYYEVGSVTGRVQGDVMSPQLCGKPYELGPHHEEQGGGAPLDDGGGLCGDGGGRRHLAPHKTKPKNVSGGLMARILAWEKKNHMEDDRGTQSDTAGGARLGGGDRK